MQGKSNFWLKNSEQKDFFKAQKYLCTAGQADCKFTNKNHMSLMFAATLHDILTLLKQNAYEIYDCAN